MNHESIDALYVRWQENPDATGTAALCEALRGGPRSDLMDIVGSHASRQPDVIALLAAARMYTDAGRLDEAQGVLISAGRIAPREGDVYRWLGEVLLRRGDAERAEKVLEKAVQFGGDPSSGPMIERARSLVPLQKTSGPAAVIEALNAVPAAKSDARGGGGQPSSRGPRRFVPADSDEDVETQIRKSSDVAGAIEAAGLTAHLPQPAAGRPPEPAPSARAAAPSVRPPPAATKRGLGDLSFDIPKQTRSLDFETSKNHNILADTSPYKSEAVAATGGYAAQRDVTAILSDGPPVAPPVSARVGPPPLRGPEPPVNPALLAALQRPTLPNGAQIPEPRDVLDALQIAGIYEPEGAIGPQVYTWQRPTHVVKRLFSTITLVGLALVLVGGGIGTYYYVNARRAKEHIQAEQLLATVDKQLAASEATQLEPAEKTIALTFELESRSTHASLTWLHERALTGLLKNGADVAFEDAMQRAKALGVPEGKVAFANIASFLFQGDTAGAAATVAKYDAAGQGDAWFQLLAGATFERAGDARSLERYAAAVRLDPELMIAQILLTRATAMDGDPRRAAELAREFRTRYPGRPEGAALVALAWTRDPLRGEPPAEIKDITEHEDGLPPSLRAVPHAARAILALHRGAVDEAKPSLQKGLSFADSPGIAAWLGSIALATGDEELARKAALTAVSFSAVYPPARSLAARVALLGGRLDEALKATEDLPPGWADVATVVAAASYEKVDSERMARAFDPLPDDAKKLPFAVPLVRGQAMLAGNLGVMTATQALDLADDEAPWADLVPMDWALDTGDTDLADKIATERWKGPPGVMRQIRLARLARYEGKLDDADRYSRAALEGGTVTLRALAERVFTLVALKKETDASALFKAYPNVGGPIAKWLRAYATAAHGKIEDAKASVASEDPPSPATPMFDRIIAAMAFGMMKDGRHGNEYVKPILAAGYANPDLAAAAEKVGLKVAKRK